MRLYGRNVSMAPKIVYDRKDCEGFFTCVTADPDRFKENTDEQKADLAGAREIAPGLFEKELDEDHLDDAITAAQGCPAHVIKVLDDDGNVLAGPDELPIEH